MNKSRKFTAFTVIVFFLTAISGAVRAQDDEFEKNFLEDRVFAAGLIAGTNFSQVDGDYFAGYYKIGLNIGGIGYAKLGKQVALSWEILYSQKGSKSNLTGIHGTDSVLIKKYGINLNYAEIPVMINFFDKHKSHVGIGVSYSRLINSSENITTDHSFSIDQEKYPFKKSDYNILLGGQLHLWKGFFLNIRYQYSLLPVRTEIPTDFSRAKQYNNLWTVRVMYLFY